MTRPLACRNHAANGRLRYLDVNTISLAAAAAGAAILTEFLAAVNVERLGDTVWDWQLGREIDNTRRVDVGYS